MAFSGVICPNPSCGAVCEPGDAFCVVCGTKLPDAATVYVPDAAARTCSACGAPLEPDAAFCTNCGRPVEPAVSPAVGGGSCPHCGALLEDDAVFCTECGRPVTEEVPPVSPTIPVTVDSIPCPHCNAANEPDADFCVICGEPLGSGDSEPTEPFGTDDGDAGASHGDLIINMGNPKDIESNKEMRALFHSPGGSI